MRAKEYEESSGWHVLVSPMCVCGFNSPSPCGIVDLLNSQEEKRRAHQCEENYTSNMLQFVNPSRLEKYVENGKCTLYEKLGNVF